MRHRIATTPSRPLNPARHRHLRASARVGPDGRHRGGERVVKLLASVAIVVSSVVVGAAFAAVDAEVSSTLETEPFFDSDDADADDPAIWVHPGDTSKSIVVGTLKNGGL